MILWYYNRMEKQGDKVSLVVRLPADLHRRIRREAYESHQSINKLLVQGAQEYMDRLESSRRDAREPEVADGRA